jgi:hypothetical protein
VLYCGLLVDRELSQYEGDHFELCSQLEMLSRSSHIKLCISSRPWLVFEDSFGQTSARQICIHELTWNDICTFARDQLESHPRWSSSVLGADDLKRRELVSSIANRAEGVFLWVFLVAKSLRQGLTNDDTIDLMERRLNSLPTGLQELFEHILERVDPIYHDQMAGFLQLSYHASTPLYVYLYWFYEQEFADPHYAINMEVKEFTLEERIHHTQQARRRISARTNGLLEVRHDCVEFLHRTVKDFLKTRQMTEYLRGKQASNQDVFCSLANVCLAFIKSSNYNTSAQNGDTLRAHVGEVCNYASHADDSSQENVTQILDQLNRTIMCLNSDHIPQQWSWAIPFNLSYWKREFESLVLAHQGLGFYVDRKRQDSPGCFQELDQS